MARNGKSPDRPVYLDYNATTPLDSRVFAAMEPWFFAPSNAGSRTHGFGQSARDAVDHARHQVANVIGAAPEEIFFTSGATESNNIVLFGIAKFAEKTGRRHIIASSIEHKAVLEPLEELQRDGFEVELLPVAGGGFVDPDDVLSRLRDDTLLVSVMHANNETGVLQPIKQIGELLRDTDTFFHTDAAQTFGKEIDELRDATCDFISFSAHKIYGPQGVGALCVRRRGSERRPIAPLSYGGGQERGLRPGTQPVALVAGLGLAAELAQKEHRQRAEIALNVKCDLLDCLKSIDYQINGDQQRAQPHVVNLSFTDVDSEALMMAVRDELAFSNGSACTTSTYAPSHVLRAMRFDENRIHSSVRISWGAGLKEIPWHVLLEAVERFRIRL